MVDEFVHVVDLLPEPAFLLARSGDVLAANGAAGELAGVGHKSLRNSRLHTLVTDPPEKVEEYLALCARSRQPVPGSFNWVLKGGRTLDIRCDGSIVRTRTADAPAVLFVRCRPKAEANDQFVLLNQKIAALSREVLERKKAEQQRDELLAGERAARMDAERASRMKDEFLATLSHELRTPLNAILGWAQVLRGSQGLAAEAAQGLDVIERNAKAQAQLIEDLLDMSRIISGKVRLDVQRVELASVIQSAIEAVGPGAEAKGIRLQHAIDPIAGPVKGDPGRLQQVVWNLLSNAVKFTPRGGRVQVFLERVNSHVDITVSDTGQGIAPEFLPHVFDRFRQADASTTRRHGGLGLGLSIVRHLVELHGGSIRAKSPGEGQGSTFIVTLPVMVLHGTEEAAGQRDHPRARPGSPDPGRAGPIALDGVKVLVVDDEPDARDLIRRILLTCRATVTVAGSGAEAMRAVEAERPDVIVSDIGMPVQDGFEFMRAVRARPADRGGRTPAVALTAFARTEDRTRAMLAGYQVHLSKPIEAAELLATVASMAGRTGGS